MDLTRTYYLSANLTASPYKLEYIYRTPDTDSNPMRRFLVATAAFRALTEGAVEGKTTDGQPLYISSSMNEVLLRNPFLITDFTNALITAQREGLPDARKGLMCAWHVHELTPKCRKEAPAEPWEGE